MNSPSMDIRDILVANLGLEAGINLFIGMEPSDPVDCVTIFDTPGYGPLMTLDPVRERYDLPAVQVRVRASDHGDGYAMVHAIKVCLHGLAHETWGGTRYELIKCDQDPFLLDYQDDRPRFVANFSMQRRPS